MANELVRVTGEVTLVDHRSGISKAGNPYTISEATVLVQRVGTVTVTLSDRVSAAEGSEVDWLTSVEVFAGRPQFRAIRDFDLHQVPTPAATAEPASSFTDS